MAALVPFADPLQALFGSARFQLARAPLMPYPPAMTVSEPLANPASLTAVDEGDVLMVLPAKWLDDLRLIGYMMPVLGWLVAFWEGALSHKDPTSHRVLYIMYRPLGMAVT